MKLCFYLPSLILTLLILLPSPSGRAEDVELRRTLEHVYHDWRSALLNKDLAAWQRATSAYRQMITRNTMVSQKQPYPEALFAIPIRPPEITNLRMLEVEAIGTTAHMIFFGKVDLGLDAEEIPENILILRFVSENSVWKFDTTRIMNLAGVPDVRASLQNGIADFLDRPEFNPPGSVPPVPPPCRKPEHVAALQVKSLGYETSVTIEGVDYPTISDDAAQHLVIGGLVRGRNEMKVNIKPLPVPEGYERELEINVQIITGNPKSPMLRVFSWDTQSAAPPEHLDLPVIVNNLTLKGV